MLNNDLLTLTSEERNTYPSWLNCEEEFLAHLDELNKLQDDFFTL